MRDVYLLHRCPNDHISIKFCKDTSTHLHCSNSSQIVFPNSKERALQPPEINKTLLRIETKSGGREKERERERERERECVCVCVRVCVCVCEYGMAQNR